jgi:hypothetical protein
MKKDYFPTAKAPDIAKQKIMQYIYGTKKSLSKRYYFYRVYAPAFLLLFIVLWGVTFYNRELRPIDETPKITKYDERQELLAKSPALRNFVSNKYADKEPSILPKTANTDETIWSDAADVNRPVSTVAFNTDNTNDTINYASPNDIVMAVDSRSSSPSNIASSASLEQSLEQQISEIENLMNDISSITAQEENLF